MSAVAIRTVYARAAEVFQFAVHRGKSPADAMAAAARVLRANKVVRLRVRHPPVGAIEIVRAVGVAHGIYSLDLLLSKGGSATRTAVLHEAMYVLRRTHASYGDIGATVRRDHSSTISAIRKFAARMAADDLSRARVDRFVEGLRAKAVAA